VLRQGLVQTATSPKSSNNSSGSSSRYFIPVDDTGDPKSAESFGSTIDFTIVYGGGVDPVWTLTNFGGPGGGSPSFVHYARTSKDTMVISFSEVKRSKPQNSQIIPQNQQYFTKTLDDDAVERANKQLDRQILQSNLRNK
jgi:hypothetical protein